MTRFLFFIFLLTAALSPAGTLNGAVSTKYFHFDILPERHKLLKEIIQSADEKYQSMADAMGLPPKSPVTVQVADTFKQFLAFQGEEGAQVEWAVGIAFPKKLKMVLRIDRENFFTLEQTFMHELNHVLLLGGAKQRHFPKWFSEGLAIYFSGEGVWRRLDVALNAASTNSMIPLEQLTFRFPEAGSALNLAYAQSGLFVRNLIESYGMDTMQELIRQVSRDGNFFSTFLKLYGRHAQTAYDDWAAGFRQGGSLLYVLVDEFLLWFIITFIFILGYVKVRRQRRLQMAEMEDYEQEYPEDYRDEDKYLYIHSIDEVEPIDRTDHNPEGKEQQW